MGFKTLVVIGFLSVLITPAVIPAQAQAPEDHKAVHAILATYIEARNTYDLKKMAALFAPNMSKVRTSTGLLRYRDAKEAKEGYGTLFEEANGSTITAYNDQVWFVDPETALIDFIFHVNRPDGSRGDPNFTTFFCRKQADGNWLISAQRWGRMTSPPPSQPGG